MSIQAPIYNLFHSLTQQLTNIFKINWVALHELNENTLSGFGYFPPSFSPPRAEAFVNLRISLNPKRYILDCGDPKNYELICAKIPLIVYSEYKLYSEVFKNGE
jgi:hypothetical protein